MLQKAYSYITESYLAMVLLALFIGVVFSRNVVFLADYSTVVLGAIFFLSALKISFNDIARSLSDKKLLTAVNVFMLIIFPVIVYYVTASLYPSLAIAFLLLAAMPAGMTSPLLAEISGGRQSLALVLTVSTSLLAPITVPFVMKMLAGATISVDFFDMFFSLAQVIFIPFILANILKLFWRRGIDKISSHFKSVSVFLLGILIMSIVAKQADVIMDGLRGGEALLYLALLFILFIIFHILGYYTIFWRERADRITTTVCLTYMNFTLAIYLADKFFQEPEIVIPVVLSVIPWAILLTPFKHVMAGVQSREAL